MLRAGEIDLLVGTAGAAEGGYLAPAAERLITLLEGVPDEDSSSRKGSPTAS